MQLAKMIAELRSERTAVEYAVAVLERLARTQGKRRGRPPSGLALVSRRAPAKKRVLSAATRKRMAQAQKKRWAAVRKRAAAKR